MNQLFNKLQNKKQERTNGGDVAVENSIANMGMMIALKDKKIDAN